MLRSLYAPSTGALLSLCLFAATLTRAQETRSTVEPPHSIISLAPAPRPQAQMLARTTSDATFAHAPANYHIFSAATGGENAGVEILRLNFDGETRLTKIESRTKDFAVEPGGTCHEGNGYSKGDSCSLMVRFNPQGPGHRSGSLNISHTAEAAPMFVGLTGNGYAPVVSFTPSMISTVTGTASGTTGTINGATNMTVDGGDILYIADIGNNLIKEIDSSGAITPLTPYFATPASLAVDSLGMIYAMNIPSATYYMSYFAPWGVQGSYGYTYAAGSCTPSTPCPLSTVGLSRPGNISIDAYDNLYFAEATKGAAEMPVANISGGTGSYNLWYLKNQFMYNGVTPNSYAVDANGNQYNYYSYTTSGTCFLLEESLYQAEYSPSATRVAGGTGCGFSGDGGQARSARISTSVGQITFDVAGNLYFADTGNQRIRRIDAATGIISTIAGTGTAGYSGDGGPATFATIANPTGVAVDSQGQVYILSNAPAAGPKQVIRKVGVSGFWSFNSVLIGTKAAPKVFTVANTGNSALTLSSNVVFTGANPGDFAIDPTTTNCVLTAGATLAAGRSCNIGITFAPAATGNRAAFLTLLDNSVTGSNSIRIVGTGTLPSPTMSITSPAAGSTAKTGATVTFAVSVTSASSTKPTGTVTFKVNGSNVGSPVTLSATGTASTTFTQSSAATYTLSAVYSGDAHYATATVSESIVVSAAVKAASVVSLSPAVATPSSCGASTFSVRVTSPSGGNPTGTVRLQSGSTMLASSALTNGMAVLSISKLVAGSHTLIASYGGDSQHLASNSAPITVKTFPAVAGACGVKRTPIVGASAAF